ncbi:MAG: AsmA-like C-terminal region-containing protein [Croceitalea sp.]|nr:AsmA-like C-terminal region-containing protein [Croceitalea sp.]
MKNKVLKIFGVLFLLVLAILIAAPIFLEGKIAQIIKNKVNNNINATLDFEDADLSLIKSFPNAHLNLTQLSLVNKAPFEGDTLFKSGTLALDMSIKELFKSADEPIAIKSVRLDEAQLHIKVDAAENANYDIAKANESAGEASSASSNFVLDLQSYEITNALVTYDDMASDMHLLVSEIDHKGQGDLSLETSTLTTKTNALLSFEMDGLQYLNKNTIALDALIGINLKDDKYSFLKNTALLNQLPLVFDGYVKLNEDNQEVDITFKTASSDFKNFLAVLPEVYVKNIEAVKTTGNFEVDGQFKGIVDDTYIPQFNININSENASFKFPDLPKAVSNVFIKALVKNETGITEATFVNIQQLSFQIDEDKFNLSSRITDLMGNTKVRANVDGKINLANLAEAFPMPAATELSGILTADVKTNFDMASVEAKKYGNTQTEGKLRVTDFKYRSDELKSPVVINTAAVTFNPKTVSLNTFEGTTGQTDFKVGGTINNLLGFMFNNEKVEGKFNMQSNTLSLNDFMVEETAETQKDPNQKGVERIKIPSFLDCTIDATANTVVYDNLNLKNVSGRLKIKDETATLEGLNSDLFEGKLLVNGSVSTKEADTKFSMNLGMDSFKISESFKALDLFKALAPVANALQGKLNSTISLSGNLNDDMTPNLATLTGNVLAELLSTKVNKENAPLLTALSNQLKFIDLDALDFSGLKTALAFENGAVSVKPFDIKYKDVAIGVAGSHTFDRQLQYTATLQVPAKYLGTDVNNLIAKLDEPELQNLSIPVVANIGGNYSSPKVTTDFTSGISKLTNQLLEMQKQKLMNKGKDKAKDLLGDILKTDKGDSTQTSTKNNEVKEVLGGLLGKPKDSLPKAKDSTAKKDAVKEAATTILGGLLNNKKKKKDTVN